MPRVRSSLALAAVLAVALIACSHLNHPDPRSVALERSETLASSSAPPRELTIATYNVHMERPAALIAAIVSDPSLRRADILLLQEIEWHGGEPRSDAATVADALGFHHLYAPGYGLKRGGSHGIAILSRLPLSEPRIIELPRRHTVVNSGRRVALAATVQVARHHVRVWNVHLDNRINPKDRAAQLEPVLAAIDAEARTNVVVAGDFNTSPFCWIGRLVPIPCGLQSRGIRKALAARGFSHPTRHTGATSKYLGMRLDAIFVRGFDASDVAVGETRLSDHFPLVAELRPSSRSSRRSSLALGGGAVGDALDGVE